MFWIWKGSDGPQDVVGLATGTDDYWWFPDVGQPGWGTSMQVGYGCFATREDCIAYALRDARHGLKRAQERLEMVERFSRGS